jgi:hypothetical protein
MGRSVGYRPALFGATRMFRFNYRSCRLSIALLFGISACWVLDAACQNPENDPAQKTPTPQSREDATENGDSAYAEIIELIDQSLPGTDDAALALRLKIGASAYGKAFELINESTHQYGCDTNPAATVRAVNHLHSLGKERAIETLRAYQRFAQKAGGDLEAGEPNQERLCVIIPLLFVPRLKDMQLPSLKRSPWEFNEHLHSKLIYTKKWELDNLIVKYDLPFTKTSISVRGSRLPDRDYLVEWVAKYGRLRDKPLRPDDDPLKIADEVCAEIKNGDDHDVRIRIRAQAWRIIRQLISPEHNQDPESPGSDDDWNKLKEKVRTLGIRWSDKLQDYVTE